MCVCVCVHVCGVCMCVCVNVWYVVSCFDDQFMLHCCGVIRALFVLARFSVKTYIPLPGH